MTYRVLLQPRAAKALSKLPPDIQGRLKAAIMALAESPRPRHATKLEGERDTWRVRTGDYRVVYVPDDERRTVVVTVVGHRREVYRR